MALLPQLTFDQSNDASQLMVTDNTGAYSATDNTGGWDAPNVLLSNLTYAVMTVLMPGGTEGTDEILIDLQPEISNSTYQFKILTAVHFGLTAGTNLPDGTYKIDLEVRVSTGSPLTYTYSTEVTLFGIKGKCVNDMLAKIAETGCDCEIELIDAAVQANTVLYAMKAAAITQRPTELGKLGDLLAKLCLTKDDCFAC